MAFEQKRLTPFMVESGKVMVGEDQLLLGPCEKGMWYPHVIERDDGTIARLVMLHKEVVYEKCRRWSHVSYDIIVKDGLMTISDNAHKNEEGYSVSSKAGLGAGVYLADECMNDHGKIVGIRVIFQ